MMVRIISTVTLEKSDLVLYQTDLAAFKETFNTSSRSSGLAFPSSTAAKAFS
jgi:hypothetical protein